MSLMGYWGRWGRILRTGLLPFGLSRLWRLIATRGDPLRGPHELQEARPSARVAKHLRRGQTPTFTLIAVDGAAHWGTHSCSTALAPARNWRLAINASASSLLENLRASLASGVHPFATCQRIG